MTKEEAGQVILEGDPFIACKTCSGNGWLPKETIELGDSVTISPRDGATIATMPCRNCVSLGLLVRDEYFRACQVLSMEVPQPADEVLRLWGTSNLYLRSSAGTIARIESDSLTIRTKLSGGGTYDVPRPKQ